MSAPDQSTIRNRLLSLMTAEDFALLAPDLEALALPKAMVLVEENCAIDRVYFPDSGIGSVVATSPEGLKAEVGLFGLDGLSPIAAVMGVEQIHKQEFMQVSGAGHVISRRAFDVALNGSPTLRRLLNAYVYTMVIQTAYTALSNANHAVDERLARWLLMCDDRTDQMELVITHEFISIMLAVRRPSVTTALHVLEGNGFISSERGLIVIRDRAAMQAFANDAYGAPEAEYRRLIGSMACRMALFFFDTVGDGVSFRDHEGSDLESAEAARKTALEILPELANHRVPLRDRFNYGVTVRDEVGRAIYQATLTVSGEWIADGAPVA